MVKTIIELIVLFVTTSCLLGDPLWFIGYEVELPVGSIPDRCIDKALEDLHIEGFRYQPELVEKNKKYFFVTRDKSYDEGFLRLREDAPQSKTVEVLFVGIGAAVPDRGVLARQSKAILTSVLQRCV